MKRNTFHRYNILGMILGVIVILFFITNIVYADGGGGRRSMGFFDVLLLPRVWIAAICCTIGFGLLMKSWVHRNLRLTSLAVVFFVFGILPALPLGKFAWGMGMHPSPVCSITKPFLFLNAGQSAPIIFLTILAFISFHYSVY